MIKLAAAFIVVLTLQSMTGYASYWMAGEEALAHTVFAFVFVVAIPLGIAAIFWYFPATISKVDRSSIDPEPTGATSPSTGIFVGITLVGLYTLVFGIIDLFYYEAIRLVEAKYLNDSGYGSSSYTPNTVAGRYTNIFQVLLGISILLGRSGLTRLLAKIRGRGGVAS